MINDKTMRLMLENMESAAEEALRDDRAFYEALRSLKAEIDRDPRVQSAVKNLQSAGSKVFSSLLPRIKIRIRTHDGVVSLPTKNQVTRGPLAEPLAQLTQELKSAASAVLMRGRHRRELDQIMNQAICGSGRFEGIASEIERAGYEVVICLDLSAYAQVRDSSEQGREVRSSCSSSAVLNGLLSGQDLKFLRAMGIEAGN